MSASKDAREAMFRNYCPYGSVGSKLWVRETFTEFEGAPNGVAYRADCVGEYADLIKRRCSTTIGLSLV